MIVTQREKRYPISNDTVSDVTDDGVKCVDDASLQMCSSRNFLHLEQRQQLTLQAKTLRRGNGAPGRPLQAFDVLRTKRIILPYVCRLRGH